MKPKSLVALTLLLLALTGAAQAQSTDPAAASLKSFYEYSKRYIIGAAEKMPAEHFSFKPTPEVRSYAELFGHIMNTNYGACAAIKGEANPNKDDLEKTARTKDEVIQAVKASFDYCDGAFKTMTDATLKETFKSGTREVSKASRAVLVAVHSFEHYGNLVTYLRLKGVVPPSSEPQRQ
jgi:uncharacterized damage-inducible protein DinB